MKELPLELRRKAAGILRIYGGLEGLAKNPPWLIGMVLKTWFTGAERREIVEYLFQGPRKEVGRLILKEMEAR